MTDTQAETSLNGSGPAPQNAEPCTDCVSGGEKALAVLGVLFGAFVIVMALDMFLGGRIGGYVTERVQR